jgi:NitT/TauT family transport system substrate-binding protein
MINRVLRWPGWLPCMATAILFLLVGCSSEPKAALRIGINSWPGYEFLYLAQEKGFYHEEGLEVRLVEFNSLSDARRAYERGQIDGLGCTVIEVLQARELSTRSPQIVQVVDYSNGADMILVRPGITNGAGLRGARIGVELASLGVYVLARGLEKNGLTLSDVKPVSTDQLTMEASFLKGDLDAVVTYPPASVNLLRENKARAFFTSAEVPGEVIDVIAIEEAICRQRPQDVTRLLRAFHRAIAYTQQHPQDAYAIMARREGMSPEEFRLALTDGVKLVSAAEQPEYLRPGGKLAKVVELNDRILREAGQIKGPDRRQGAFDPAFAGAGDSKE